jgi:hypothetical protein
MVERGVDNALTKVRFFHGPPKYARVAQSVGGDGFKPRTVSVRI